MIGHRSQHHNDFVRVCIVAKFKIYDRALIRRKNKAGMFEKLRGINTDIYEKNNFGMQLVRSRRP